jgi:microcin C transport system ATP-binding protein
MKEGKVIEAGPARQIFEKPRSPYTQALLAAALDLEANDNKG